MIGSQGERGGGYEGVAKHRSCRGRGRRIAAVGTIKKQKETEGEEKSPSQTAIIKEAFSDVQLIQHTGILRHKPINVG